MAKRRKKRARVGSVSDTLLKIAGVAAGQIGGGVLNNLVSGKSTTSTDAKTVYKSNLYVNIGETVLGAGAATYAPKGSFWEYLGIGMASDGTQRTVQSSMSGIAGTNLNRRTAAVGKTTSNGSGKLGADTWEVV
jgi:hypothetical protein